MIIIHNDHNEAYAYSSFTCTNNYQSLNCTAPGRLAPIMKLLTTQNHTWTPGRLAPVNLHLS